MHARYKRSMARLDSSRAEHAQGEYLLGDSARAARRAEVDRLLAAYEEQRYAPRPPVDSL